MQDRGCTDIFCCVIFLLWVVVCIAITGYGFANGTPDQLLVSYDNGGNRCGAVNLRNGDTDNTYKPYGFKHFPFLDKIADTSNMNLWKVGVCVKECPRRKAAPLKPNTHYVPIANSTHSWAAVNGDVAVPFDTFQLAGFCVPEWNELAKQGETLYKQFDAKTGGAMTRYMVDLAESWQVLLGMAFASLVITLIYVYLLRYITKCLLYISLVGLFVFGAAFSGWNFYKWNQSLAGSSESQTALTIGIIVAIVTIIYLVCICCLWSAIQLGAAIMTASSDFISSTTRLALVPTFTFVMTLPIIFWWLIASVYLYGTGEFKYIRGNAFTEAKLQNTETIMFWVLLVGILWIVIFLVGLQSFITAAAGVQWYFFGQGSDTDGVKDDVKIYLGVGWAFKHHIGTIAFGSFLITLTTLIKFIFEYFASQAEQMQGENACVKIFLCVARCCIYCVDCCVRFISDNAYIQCAINGTNFCESAQTTFYLAVRNPASFTAVNYISWIMMVLGKGLIVASSAWLTYILTQYALPNIQQPVVPAIANGIWAFFVASLYLGLYDFSALVILNCYLINYEVGGNRHTPDSLKDFIDKLEDHEVMEAEKRGDVYEKRYNKGGVAWDVPNTKNVSDTNDAKANGMS